MNREIKFRAWEDTCMIYSHNVKNFSGDNLVAFFDRIIDEGSIMQYIGLKDKNGKDVYEGDIVLDWFGTKREVVFGKIGYDSKWNGLTGFYFKSDDYDFLELQYHNNPLDLEVIGNIYENTELLKNE
jgi:uncharacterized phage protein (TIGR01671 family)